MNEYVKQAQDFLTSCSATMEIAYTGMELNSNWKDKELRNTYFATITTPLGNYEYIPVITKTNLDTGEITVASLKEAKRFLTEEGYKEYLEAQFIEMARRN